MYCFTKYYTMKKIMSIGKKVIVGEFIFVSLAGYLQDTPYMGKRNQTFLY